MQYYAKLGCLLIDHGTEGIRNYFHNHILRGQTPRQFFTTNKTHIDNLHHGRHGCKRLINKRQYDLIFPANNQPPDLKGFDITLIFLLIRQFQVRIYFLENILRGQSFSDYMNLKSVQSILPPPLLCNLIPKGGALPQFDSTSSHDLYKLIQNLHPITTHVYPPNAPVWDDPAKASGAPQDMQDIVLFKFERNSLAHRKSTDISLSEFEQKWTTISSAVIRLGVMTPSEIQELKHKPIEPEREMSYQVCILHGYLEEMEMLRFMQNMDVKLDHVYAMLSELYKRREMLSYHHVQQTLTVQETNLRVETHYHPVHTEERPERKTEQGILSEKQLTLLQNHLAARYNREMSCVPRIPWDETDTMNIDDVFVDLSLIQEQKEGGGTKKVELKSYHDIFRPDIRKKRIIIRGKAGSGKSTVAAKMAVDWARFKFQSSNRSSTEECLYNRTKRPQTEGNHLHYLENMSLLFLIRLRFLDKDQTLLDSIKDQLIDPSLEITDEAMLKYMHSNAERILIILDGYDEYNMDSANPQNDISKLIKGETFANVTVIITSRPWKAHELSKHRPSDTHVEINDMSPDEIDKFIQNHFKGRDPGYHEYVVCYVLGILADYNEASCRDYRCADPSTTFLYGSPMDSLVDLRLCINALELFLSVKPPFPSLESLLIMNCHSVWLRFLDKDQTLLDSIKDQLIDPSLEITDEALLNYMHSNAERILIILDGYDEYNIDSANPQNNISKLIKGETLANVTRLLILARDKEESCDSLSAHPNSTFLSGSPMDCLVDLGLDGDVLGLFFTLKHPFPSLKVLGICSCSPLGKLVDLFQLLSTKSMVNLLLLDLSNTVMTECETCQRLGDEVKSERARGYKRDPLIVTLPPYHINAFFAILKRFEFDIPELSGEHTILIDTLCDLASQLKHLPNLEKLGLFETKITPVGLKSLTDNLHHVPRLQVLNLSYNFAHMGLISNIDIPAVIRDLFRKLQPMNMTCLDISGCNIGLLGDMGPAMEALSDNLKQWKELCSLNISNNSIGDAIAHVIDSLNRTNLPRLENELISSNNMLSEAVLNNYAGKLNAMPGLTNFFFFNPYGSFPEVFWK
ncbi:uncharacterized protein LOC106162461 [Lingula anatina]|uniref:Uncharacterized protein LOC106162461 n=1 Tax=Lingula anatina TaxID=7574 RepID=A0A2R2MIJ3_LINAN|nr:uncharacterized protein LOC106162461 [Lingula anatina]|eukprot:XP_023930045.1 uncharacterized protein LOC106162461 [Lingula anatina]